MSWHKCEILWKAFKAFSSYVEIGAWIRTWPKKEKPVKQGSWAASEQFSLIKSITISPVMRTSHEYMSLDMLDMLDMWYETHKVARRGLGYYRKGILHWHLLDFSV
jgi:hypothetical protein